MDKQKRRVLLVEDDVALGATLRDELEASGFAVEPAVTAEEALRKAEARLPDVILLDLLFGGGTGGVIVLSQLKQSDRTRGIPVVVLSSVGDDDTVQKALELGASAVFVKTRYGLPDLLDRLHVLLKTGRN